jgi:hypothetical protein
VTCDFRLRHLLNGPWAADFCRRRCPRREQLGQIVDLMAALNESAQKGRGLPRRRRRRARDADQHELVVGEGQTGETCIMQMTQEFAAAVVALAPAILLIGTVEYVAFARQGWELSPRPVLQRAGAIIAAGVWLIAMPALLAATALSLAWLAAEHSASAPDPAPTTAAFAYLSTSLSLAWVIAVPTARVTYLHTRVYASLWRQMSASGSGTSHAARSAVARRSALRRPPARAGTHARLHRRARRLRAGSRATSRRIRADTETCIVRSVDDTT